MNKLTCPYSENGICYRNGCIYLPNFKCITKSQHDKQIHLSKKKKVKKAVKKK